MANPGHCFYCFESLKASFERRDPPSLEKVLILYDQYMQKDEDNTEDENISEDHSTNDRPIPDHTTSRPQLPSISRLQAPSTPSSDSSTPSSLSTSSSTSHLTNTTSHTSLNTTTPTLSPADSFPLFVTWNTLSRHSTQKSLRGCIGTFDPLPLATGLSSYALTSAFDDTRFQPIPSSLVPSLQCALTLLANFESCDDALDWSLGEHGLRISFTVRGRRYGATYLPDVAVEQGWGKEETVESLMRKAGWDGAPGGGRSGRLFAGRTEGTETRPWEEVEGFKAVRYTGLKSSASYAEWQDWRTWVEVRRGEGALR